MLVDKLASRLVIKLTRLHTFELYLDTVFWTPSRQQARYVNNTTNIHLLTQTHIILTHTVKQHS